MFAARPLIPVISPLAFALAFALAVACGGGDAQPASKTAAGGTSAATPATALASGADSVGRQIYATCTTCHLATGQGIPGTYPPLAGSDLTTGAPEIPIAIVLHGLHGPIKVSGKDYNNIMTPWGPVFNDVQIAAVLTYVRSQWGNSASAVTAEQVAKVRAATSSRTTMWTWPELQAFKF